MSYLLSILFIFIFSICIWKLPCCKIQGVPQWLLLAVFGVKLISSVVLHYIYTVYYPDRTTADIFKYFDDAVVLFESTQSSWEDFFRILFSINCDAPDLSHYFENTNHWSRLYEYAPFLDNRLIIRTNMIILLLSRGCVAVHYIFADFISFIGLILIYKTFLLFVKHNYIAFSLIFLMPSTLLWSAGILKECLLLFAIGCLVYGFCSILHSYRFYYLLLFCIGLLLLVVLKFYVLVAFIPVLLAYTLQTFFPLKRPIYWYVSIFLCGITLLLIFDLGTHHIPFFESFVSKRGDAINTAELYNAQTIIPIEKIGASFKDIITHSPQAWWNAISLPYCWQCNSIVQFIPSLESLLFFALILLTIFVHKPIDDKFHNFFCFCIFFSIILLWEIGFSTAVVGGLVRYKIPIFTFLYVPLAYCIDWKKIGHNKCSD